MEVGPRGRARRDGLYQRAVGRKPDISLEFDRGAGPASLTLFAKVAAVPLYEYQCQPHSHRFEVRHGIHENPVTSCPECGGEVRRVIHPVGIVFKGSGFYATDSRGKSDASKAGSSSSAPSSSESKKDSSKDSKTESTSPS